jgi:ABC-type phosphate/phosphonate transport system ATPase subunit
VAEALKSLTEAVLENTQISSVLKNELIQNIGFVSQQVSVPAEHRNQGVLKSVLTGIKNSVATVSSLVDLWSKAESLFRSYFGL